MRTKGLKNMGFKVAGLLELTVMLRSSIMWAKMKEQPVVMVL